MNIGEVGRRQRRVVSRRGQCCSAATITPNRHRHVLMASLALAPGKGPLPPRLSAETHASHNRQGRATRIDGMPGRSITPPPLGSFLTPSHTHKPPANRLRCSFTHLDSALHIEPLGQYVCNPYQPHQVVHVTLYAAGNTWGDDRKRGPDSSSVNVLSMQS